MNNDDVILVVMIFVAIVLALLVSVGYDKYSYNHGFYDGLKSICDGEILIRDDVFICNYMTTEEFYNCEFRGIEYENSYNWT